MLYIAGGCAAKELEKLQNEKFLLSVAQTCRRALPESLDEVII